MVVWRIQLPLFCVYEWFCKVSSVFNEFNHSSSNNYSTALQLAASITAGLAEVQSGKGFSPVSGTFSTQGLNMDWVSSIQGIIEEQARQTEMKQITLQKQQFNLQE